MTLPQVRTLTRPLCGASWLRCGLMVMIFARRLVGVVVVFSPMFLPLAVVLVTLRVIVISTTIDKDFQPYRNDVADRVVRCVRVAWHRLSNSGTRQCLPAVMRLPPADGTWLRQRRSTCSFRGGNPAMYLAKRRTVRPLTEFAVRREDADRSAGDSAAPIARADIHPNKVPAFHLTDRFVGDTRRRSHCRDPPGSR